MIKFTRVYSNLWFYFYSASAESYVVIIKGGRQMYYISIYEIMFNYGLSYDEAHLLLTHSGCPTYSNHCEYFVEAGEFDEWLQQKASIRLRGYWCH